MGSIAVKFIEQYDTFLLLVVEDDDDDDDDDVFYASLARLWAYGGCLKCSISLRLPGIYLTGRRPFYLCYNNNVHLTDVQVSASVYYVGGCIT